MSLQIEAFEKDGETYRIKQASAFRTFQYQKAMKDADGDDVKAYEHTAEFLRLSVVDDSDGTRWTKEQFDAEVSISLFQWLQAKVMEYNELQKTLDEVTEEAAKN